MAIEEENHDLSPRTEALLAMTRDDVVEHILVELQNASITPARVREYIEGRLAREAVVTS
jgi:hypothetical protein